MKGGEGRIASRPREVSEEIIGDHVSLYVTHLAQQVLLNCGKPLHTHEIVKELSSEVTLSPEYLRRLLHRSDNFVFHRRRWELRWRYEAREASLEGVVSSLLSALGYPISINEICKWLSEVGKGEADTLTNRLLGLLRSRKETFWEVSEGRFGLRSWLIDTSVMDENTVIADSFFGREEEVKDLLRRADELAIDFSLPLNEVCQRLIDGLSKPLSHAEITLICWRGLNYKPTAEEVLGELFSAPNLRVLSPGYWCTDTVIEKLRRLAEEASKEKEAIARMFEDVDKMLKRAKALISRPKAPSPIVINSEDWDDMLNWLREKGSPTRIDVILLEAFELDHTDTAYLPTLHELHDRLSKDVRFVNVGNHRWWLREALPKHIQSIPDELLPKTLNVEGALKRGVFDIELPDEALEPDLLRWVNEPEYEDVGEPVKLQLAPKVKRSTAIPIPHHHIVAGTMKLREIDKPMFGDEAKLQYYIAKDEHGLEFPVWVNMETGLVFGFKEWYEQRGIGPGALVKLEVVRGVGELKLTWNKKYDRHLHLPSGRVNQLLSYARQEAVARATVVELMQSIIMPFYEEGVHFLRLWAEVNFLRRTSKRLIASILSLYACFTRHPQREGYWLYEYERSAEGIRREKRKLVERLIRQTGAEGKA